METMPILWRCSRQVRLLQTRTRQQSIMFQKSRNVIHSIAHLRHQTTCSKLGFRYRPLNPQEIRLARILPHSSPTEIHCSLQHFSVVPPGTTPYIALSYCWGDSPTRKYITLNGHPFAVTASLWDVLSNIIKHHNRDANYWIDSVCLNQDDIPERNQQVQKMWQIFHNAKEVYAWLGPADESSEKAFRLLNGITRSLSYNSTVRGQLSNVGSQLLNMDDVQDHGEVLGSLSRKDYFKRTWIIPEILQARDIRLLCGKDVCKWEAFNHYRRHYPESLSKSCCELLDSRSHVAVDWILGSNCDPDDMFLVVFFEKLRGFMHSKCMDRRDRLYALLSHPIMELLHPDKRFAADYSLSVDVLVLVILSWHDRLRKDAQAEFSQAVLEELLMILSVGLELPEIRYPETFRRWIESHSQWNCSRLPQCIIVDNGRDVDCSGENLQFLLKDSTANQT